MSSGYLGKVAKILNYKLENKHARIGIPLFLFLVFGFAICRECMLIKKNCSRGSRISVEEMEKLGLKMNKEVETLEEAYEKYKQIDVDNWVNIRGPRPWDEKESE